MVSGEAPGVRIVVGERSYEVTVTQPSVLSVVVSVAVDGVTCWSSEVAGWRSWSCGARGDVFYVWTAGDLVCFAGDGGEPSELSVDEDLLWVYLVAQGWVLVCETSVRLVVNGEVRSRVECNDVIEAVSWVEDRLIVSDQSGMVLAVSVEECGLVVSTIAGPRNRTVAGPGMNDPVQTAEWLWRCLDRYECGEWSVDRLVAATEATVRGLSARGWVWGDEVAREWRTFDALYAVSLDRGDAGVPDVLRTRVSGAVSRLRSCLRGVQPQERQTPGEVE